MCLAVGQKQGCDRALGQLSANDGLPDEILHMAEVEHLLEPEPVALPGQSDSAANIAKLRSSAEVAHRVLGVLAERILTQARQKAEKRGVVDIRTLIEEGDPVEQILACAKREDADLIVLGSRGLSDLKGLLMGSVSHQVCQLATCTCITVK